MESRPCKDDEADGVKTGRSIEKERGGGKRFCRKVVGCRYLNVLQPQYKYSSTRRLRVNAGTVRKSVPNVPGGGAGAGAVRLGLACRVLDRLGLDWF